jgi:hypothetical protein
MRRDRNPATLGLRVIVLYTSFSPSQKIPQLIEPLHAIKQRLYVPKTEPILTGRQKFFCNREH